MYIKSFSRKAVLLVGAIVIAIPGCTKPEAPKETAFATVNGEAITPTEFLAFVERKPTVMVRTEQGDQEAQISGMFGLQALRDIINRKILLQLAKEDGVLPTDADVEAELKFQEEQPNSFVKALIAEGVPAESLKADIRVSLARERLQTKGITVTPAEVDKYIKDNQDRFMEPAKAKLQWVVVTDPKKKALVDKDLKGGESFAAVAVRYSEAPDARQQNGAFGLEVIDQMPEELKQIVNKLSPSKASAWITLGPNSAKFYLVEKTPKKPMEITANRKEALRRSLALQKGSAANDVTKRVTDKLRAAKVEVANPDLKQPWEKAFEMAKTQLAQEEAAAAAATANSANAPAPGAPSKMAPPTGN